MRRIVFLAALVLPLIVAACLGGPRMMEIELTDAQKRFKTKTTFEDGVFSVEFTPENGATRTLNTRLHQSYSSSYRLPPPVLPGFSSRAWHLTDNADDGRTFGYALVTWNRDDPTDYLSAGWWLHLPPGLSFRNRHEAETGVFMDGPELDLSNPPDLPLEGQAVYAGTTGGVYRYQPVDGDFEEYEYNAVHQSRGGLLERDRQRLRRLHWRHRHATSLLVRAVGMAVETTHGSTYGLPGAHRSHAVQPQRDLRRHGRHGDASRTGRDGVRRIVGRTVLECTGRGRQSPAHRRPQRCHVRRGGRCRRQLHRHIRGPVAGEPAAAAERSTLRVSAWLVSCRGNDDSQAVF